MFCVTSTTDSPAASSFSGQSTEEYRPLVEGINKVVFSTDLCGNFTYVSPYVVSLAGFSPSELTGKNITAFVAFGDRDRLSRQFSAALGGKCAPAEYTLLHKNGSFVNVRWDAVPLVSAGAICGVIGLFGDPGTQERTGDGPAETEEKIQKIVHYSRDGIIVTDERGRLAEWNPAMEQITGIVRADAIGKPLWDVMYSLRPPGIQDLDAGAEIKGRFCARIADNPSQLDRGSVMEIERPDKTRCTVESFQFLIPSDKGTLVAAVVRDISDRVKDAEALRHVNRQLSLMNSITRHDITNKVTAMLGYLCVAEMNYPDPALQEYFRKMEMVAKSIQSQIEFTRIYEDLGSQEPKWQDLDRILPRLRFPAQIGLISQVEGVRVLADPMLERVFYNLLDNTVRHGRKVTVVTISACSSKEGLSILWEDDGIGIPAYEKDRIFDRGFGKNTGLGLFLVREILLLTGATIRETGEPGKGARFEILVPNGAYRCPAGQGR